MGGKGEVGERAAAAALTPTFFISATARFCRGAECFIEIFFAEERRVLCKVTFAEGRRALCRSQGQMQAATPRPPASVLLFAFADCLTRPLINISPWHKLDREFGPAFMSRPGRAPKGNEEEARVGDENGRARGKGLEAVRMGEHGDHVGWLRRRTPALLAA